ncbi:MAG: SLBB domain-containing protein [Lachnoclostridium sp.]
MLDPGVYEFAAGSRIYEAIKAAGGLLDSAAVSVLNQAEKMEDGQKIMCLQRMKCRRDRKIRARKWQMMAE